MTAIRLMNAFQPLTLGTVQLGLPYGIANASGQPDQQQARQILEAALASRFEYLDTAPSYGTSEQTLGELLPAADPQGRAQVVSKVPAGVPPAQWEEQLRASLSRLQRPSLHAWLLHDETDFARIDAVAEAMITSAKTSGRIGAFGVSCYTAEITRAAVLSPLVTVLQVPGNVFDRRFLDAEFAASTSEKGIFVFVRSVFLQGLCLMAPEQVSPRLPGAVEGVRLLQAFCEAHNVSRQVFCLHYMNYRLRGRRHSLVLGVETAAQLLDLVSAMRTTSPADEVFSEWETRWPESHRDLVNPTSWPKYL